MRKGKEKVKDVVFERRAVNLLLKNVCVLHVVALAECEWNAARYRPISDFLPFTVFFLLLRFCVHKAVSIARVVHTLGLVSFCFWLFFSLFSVSLLVVVAFLDAWVRPAPTAPWEDETTSYEVSVFASARARDQKNPFPFNPLSCLFHCVSIYISLTLCSGCSIVMRFISMCLRFTWCASSFPFFSFFFIVHWSVVEGAARRAFFSLLSSRLRHGFRRRSTFNASKNT